MTYLELLVFLIFHHTKNPNRVPDVELKKERAMKITIETIDEAKERIRANPKKGATPKEHGKEIGVPIFFDVILDISGSMSDFYDELVYCFNNIMIPALKKAGERYKGSLRIGCLLFSDELVPAWRGYRSLDELGQNPLKKKMLEQNGLKGYTALYGAMRAGILWTAAAMEYMREKGDGEVPKGKIIILTDGANNKPPMEEAIVMKTLASIGKENRKAFKDRGKDNLLIGYFNTSEGLSKNDFMKMAEKTGFEGLGFYDIAKGGTLEEKRAAFRHYFGIFSSQATNR